MKQKTLLAAAMAIAMTACTQDENPIAPQGKLVTVTAGIDQEPDTRIYFNDDGEQTKVVWKANDTFGIYYQGDGNTNAHEFALIGEAGNTTGNFTNTSLASVTVPKTKIYAAYCNSTLSNANVSNIEYSFSPQDGTTPNRHLMVATVNNDVDKKVDWEDLNFSFENKTAILAITLKNADFINKSVTDITIAGAGLIKKATYTFATGKWTGSTNNATILISNKVFDNTGAYTIYIAQPPMGTATGPITVNATCGTQNYTATLGSGAFNEPNMYKIEADMYEAGEMMQFTIKTTAANQEFTLPFVGSPTPADLTVNWGEGDPVTIPVGTTSGSDITKKKYTKAGTYTITLTTSAPATAAQMPRWFFANYSTSAPLLKSMDTPMLKMADANFSNCFHSCNKLESIHPALFSKNTNAKNFNACFVGCSALKEIPNGLFHGISDANDFGSCFSNCRKAKINPNIFCNDATESQTRFAGKEMNFMHCFAAVGANLTTGQAGTAPRLWLYKFDGTDYTNCFSYCHNMVNWSDILSTWGGPLE